MAFKFISELSTIVDRLTVLHEAPPLPDDWDTTIYTPKTSFAAKVKYAQERATKLGAGSSRIAFVIPYEGRDTVLKIAKNRKGQVQNQEESALFEDTMVIRTGMTIPMIDYDTEHDMPEWIHVEKADKIREHDFVRDTGVNLHTLIEYAIRESGSSNLRSHWLEEFNNIDEDNDTVTGLVNLLSLGLDILPVDLYRLANWGMYNGKPVIIDLGFTSTSKELYMR